MANDLSAVTFVSGNANVVNDTFRTGSWNFYVANTISANSITGSSASTEWTSGSLLSGQYVFDGTLVGGTTLVVDAGSRVPGNPYLKFNNPTYNTSPYQYAQFTPVSIPSGGISFSMWVKHTTLVANTYPIYFSIRGNGNNLEMGLANPTPEWYVIVGGAVIKVDGTVSTITNGNWHHLVWTISSSGMFNMYLDGSLRKTQQSTYPTTGLRTAYNIGTYNNTGDPNYLINGGIDNFKLFTRELTASEVTAEYNNNTTNLQFMLMTDSGSAPKWRIKPAIPVDTTETNYTVKSNEIALTPGTNSTYAVWTAPKTTRIVIDVSFADYHSMSAGVGFQMFKINANNSFGSVIFPRTVTSTALTNAASTNYLSVPSSTISVNAGDKIYYRIDANGNPTSASSVLATTISTETTIQENIGEITTNLSATDSSMNTIRTNLSSYILSNDASLGAIRTSIQQLSTTGAIQDPSINEIILYNSNQDSSINTIRSSLSNYASLLTDASFAGNIQIGTSRTVYVGINKSPSTAYALDISGDLDVNGNTFLGMGTNRVGINTTSPAYTLDVSGTLNARSILVNGGAVVPGYSGNLFSFDTSFNGNVQIGSTRAQSLGINKTPSALFALDVSGPTSFFGNVSMDKRTTDISYAYFDMSAVTMNVYNLCEKFVIMPTITSGSSVVCNYILGSIFYFPSTTSSVITDVSFTNVPVVIGRSVTITVIIENSTNTVVTYLNPTTSTIRVNGQAIAYKTQDGTAFTAPTGPSTAVYWQVVHQFIMLFTSATLSATNPRIIGSMATIK